MKSRLMIVMSIFFYMTSLSVSLTNVEAQAEPLTRDANDYVVQPDDALQITVYEEPDLSTLVRVTPIGEVHFPLLGRISAVGMTVLELQQHIEDLLEKDYLVNPQVNVYVQEYHTRNVFVTGAVATPGSYPLPVGKPTTIMEAIVMAGGFTDEAAKNRTRIIRNDNGKEKTIMVKGKAIEKGDQANDVDVLPNDVIFVPESFF